MSRISRQKSAEGRGGVREDRRENTVKAEETKWSHICHDNVVLPKFHSVPQKIPFNGKYHIFYVLFILTNF